MGEGERLMSDKQRRMVLRAPAKLNLALDITGRREDGYHTMEMVMQAIDLCDTVSITLRRTPGIAITCTNPQVPCDGSNLCCKAATYMFARAGAQGVGLAIHLEKRVPMEAGMAGGSADAAAVLVGLNRLLDAGLSQEQLCSIGLMCGADVPFCILGGTAHSAGIGELLTPLPPLPDCAIVVAKPAQSVKTAECFARFDKIEAPPSRPDLTGIERALASGELAGVAERLCNVMEAAVPLESVRQAKALLQSSGALGACMTGSGSAVFGIYPDDNAAKNALSQIRNSGLELYLAHPLRIGAHCC